MLNTRFETKKVTLETGKTVNLKAFSVNPSEIRAFMKEAKSSDDKNPIRSLSFEIISSAKKLMKAEEYGDSAKTNFALSVFENALDYRLGLAVCSYIDLCAETFNKTPKPFSIGVDSKGNLHIITFSGKIRSLTV